MSLCKLIYASKLCPNIDQSELARIHHTAGQNNKSNDITGVLVFGNDFFLQYIEGSGENLNKLFKKIMKDPRHEDFTLIEYSEIPTREYQNWAMKLFMLTSENLKLARSLTRLESYDPRKMSGQIATDFIRTFKGKL